MTAVLVTRYKAKDGSLHDSQTMADYHDEWTQRQRRVDAVSSAIRDSAIDFMRERFRDAYENMDNWEIEHATEAIAEICIKHVNAIQSGANRK